MTILVACGTACIVSNISSLPEVGDASLTFDPNDVSDLKHKMRLITEDEELVNLRLKSLERKCFSWDDYANDFNKIVIQTVQ
jgi:glycosyltransferase involved in cell wall biosynthesis